MNVKDFSAEQILAIPVQSFDRLFSHNDFETELKQLRRVWHPDFHGNSVQSNAVFTHITALHAEAYRSTQAGTWPGNAAIYWTAIGTLRRFEMRYRRVHALEIGMMYVSDRNVLFMVAPEFEKLFHKTMVQMSSFKYASPEMEKQFKPLLPTVVHSSKTTDGRFAVVLKKTDDVFLLRDVIDFCKGAIDAKHVAWIISRLHNIAAYFQYSANISHQALSPDTVFVSLKYHTVLTLGGWWYASSLGETVSQVPGKLLADYPRALLRDKLAIVKTDQALIKALGLELLGDKTHTGTPLLGNPKVPPAMLRYLQCPPESSAAKSFADWTTVLQESFGKRTFVEFPVSADDIYS